MSLAEHFNKQLSSSLRKELKDTIIKNLSSSTDEKAKLKGVDDLGVPSPQALYDLMSSMKKTQSLNSFARNNMPTAQLITNVWQKAVEVRRQYVMNCDRVRQSSIADAILELVSQDVINPDDRGNIMEIKSSRPEIDRELQILQKTHNFDSLLREVVRDFIDFGELTLKTTYERGVGLVNITDNIDQVNVLAFYDGSVPVNFLVLKENGKFEVGAPYEYTHFVMGHNKLRILLRDQLDSGFNYTSKTFSNNIPDEIKEEIPDYVRIGKPFFFSTLENLEQLEILERLIPAMKLNELVSPQLVAVKVQSMDPARAAQACKTIESIINVPINVDIANSIISIPDLVNQSAQWKAIPDFSSEKGHLETLNTRQSMVVDDVLKALNDYRSALLSKLGLPPSLMFAGTATSDADAEKSKELRINGRYARMLGNIRRAIIAGFVQICLGHLVNKGIEVVAEDIEIIFKYKLSDLSGLESLELDDAKQAIVSNVIDFVNKIFSCKFLANAVKQKVLMEHVNDKFLILTDGIDMFDLNFEELPADQLMPIAPPKAGDADSDKDDPFVDLDDSGGSSKKSDDQEID